MNLKEYNQSYITRVENWVTTSPVLVATWPFGAEACEVGWKLLIEGRSALDAVEAGANAVELNTSVNSVGVAGLPNAEGVVELDAAIMDGRTHSAGAVAAITGISRPISVARRVMESTPHVMLAGNNARRYALQQGFESTELLTDGSREKWQQWVMNKSAPEVAHFDNLIRDSENIISHDTVGVCALDINGDLAAACTTSGMAWKIPGRVGDSPIVGSGIYVDNDFGAVTATGNGDEMMKVCLSYRVMMFLEQGKSPQEACEDGIRYLLRKRPGHQSMGAACLAIGKDGSIGSAATRDGFCAPDRLWQYACVSNGEVRVVEGVYVSL